MQTEFTKEFMQENCGCYSQEQLYACYFMQSDTVTLSAILNSEISPRDKFWFVCKKLASKEQNQQIAIGLAEIVLEIYESKYPDNKAPREAIQAAKDYLSGAIGAEELRTKRQAADAAAYAAYAAADAAYAAADAAYAAADAAYAAADAAAADATCATYATDAAATGKSGKDYKALLLDFIINFCLK